MDGRELWVKHPVGPRLLSARLVRDEADRPVHKEVAPIPTVADRVLMAAAKIVLEPIFEADFHPSSFGFRPRRWAQQALESVRVAGNQGRVWVLDADIKACFDRIDHDALIAQQPASPRRFLSPDPPVPA